LATPDPAQVVTMSPFAASEVKALFFDVFGTLVDWRGSIAREAGAVLEPLGHTADWPAFADAWRGEYQPAMEEVRAGRIPFSKLDVLHRRNLDRVLPRFGMADLPEEVKSANLASRFVRGRPIKPLI
jgi:2-haloacid dehalogenase